MPANGLKLNLMISFFFIKQQIKICDKLGVWERKGNASCLTSFDSTSLAVLIVRRPLHTVQLLLLAKVANESQT